jgi:2-oxoglutarate ferredoxin oxidoreductase subunit alpha
MTPVIFMSDLYIAFGAEPWLIPQVSDLPAIDVDFPTDTNGFEPYLRDEATLARPWAIPGTPGLEHRIGGLEKADISGNVSYDPDNHEHMVHLRAEKVARIANDIPSTEVFGEPSGELLVLSWGGTYGAVRTAVEHKQAESKSVSHVHLRYLNPLPKELGDIMKNFKKVLIPELNLGQLRLLIRAEYLVDAVGLNKIQGQPFHISEVESKIDELLKGDL